MDIFTKKNTLMLQKHKTLEEIIIIQLICGSAFRLSLYPMHHIFPVLFPTMHHILNLENSLGKSKTVSTFSGAYNSSK